MLSEMSLGLKTQKKNDKKIYSQIDYHMYIVHGMDVTLDYIGLMQLTHE